jgi:hypothetical protein
MRYLVVIILGAALSVSACGKRGGPFPPEGTEGQYPHSYPDATVDDGAQKTSEWLI